jgi:hypothetical protein
MRSRPSRKAANTGGSAEHRRRREPEKRAAAFAIVANDGGGEDEVEQADKEVRDTEQHGVVSEGARHRQRDAEHRAPRGYARWNWSPMNLQRAYALGFGNHDPRTSSSRLSVPMT